MQNDKKYNKDTIIVYSSSNESSSAILEKIRVRFGIDVDLKRLRFVKLRTAQKMAPASSLTLFWQMIGYW